MSETAILWIMGGQTALLLGLLSILWARQSAHEQRCGEWQRGLMEEHGEIKANISTLLRKSA